MKILSFLTDVIFPNRCPFCRKVIAWNETACYECTQSIEYCSDRLRFIDSSLKCVSVCNYEGTAKQGLLNLKYDTAVNLPDFFAEELGRTVSKYFGRPDMVTCVPATRATLRERGYNQAELIAKAMSDSLSVPYDCKLLSKKNGSAAQHTLSADERISNARDTYFKGKSNRSLTGLKVLLCDDIVTTGATLAECAKVLKRLGAEEIVCVTIASTRLHNMD